MKILLVEDEKELRKSIKLFLTSGDNICESAENFTEGLDLIESYDYDCILIDLSLPDGNGLDLIKRLKELNRQEGIIIISAKDAIDDKVKGLELGADDYLMKPFHLAELNARIKSLVRRKRFGGVNTVVIRDLELDLSRKEVRLKGERLNLTRTEYNLLHYMMSNQNRVLTKDSIAEHIYGNDIAAADSFDFLYSHVKNLKKKLHQGDSVEYIKSVYGIGYKLSNPGEDLN